MRLNKTAGMMIVMSLLCLCESGPGLFAQEQGIVKEYYLDFHCFSYDPEAPIRSYRAVCNEALSARSATAFPWNDIMRSFRTTVRGILEDKRWFVEITIDPSDKDSVTEPMSKMVDLTDLKARSIILMTNNDGRVYQINLLPSVRATDFRPRQIDPSEFRLERMDFPNSVVIFNDSFYAGRMSVSGGILCFVEYPGIAKVEFAMKPFRNAKPMGTLQGGNIHIQHEEGQTLDIIDVKNGRFQEKLKGGPYTIWARWTSLPPKEPYQIPAKEEWVSMIKAKAAREGYPMPSPEELDKQYQRLQYKRPKALVGGVRTSIPPEDRL